MTHCTGRSLPSHRLTIPLAALVGGPVPALAKGMVGWRLGNWARPGRRVLAREVRRTLDGMLLVPFDFQAAYDALNPDDADHRFYADLASRLSAQRAVDLGCGTGTLALLLARGGRQVIGIDPDPEMLRVARQRAGNELVTWQQGYANAMPAAWADLVTMSGHVSQVFTTDEQWREALRDVHRGLVPSGFLAFEMRNPGARAWERWNREQTLRVVETDQGPVEFWHETTKVDLSLVTYATTDYNTRTGCSSTSLNTLAFRNETSLRASLTDVGFAVLDMYGDWDRGHVRQVCPELIVVAQKV